MSHDEIDQDFTDPDGQIIEEEYCADNDVKLLDLYKNIGILFEEIFKTKDNGKNNLALFNFFETVLTNPRSRLEFLIDIIQNNQLKDQYNFLFEKIKTCMKGGWTKIDALNKYFSTTKEKNELWCNLSEEKAVQRIIANFDFLKNQQNLPSLKKLFFEMEQAECADGFAQILLSMRLDHDFGPGPEICGMTEAQCLTLANRLAIFAQEIRKTPCALTNFSSLNASAVFFNKDLNKNHLNIFVDKLKVKIVDNVNLILNQRVLFAASLNELADTKNTFTELIDQESDLIENIISNMNSNDFNSSFYSSCELNLLEQNTGDLLDSFEIDDRLLQIHGEIIYAAEQVHELIKAIATNTLNDPLLKKKD